MLEGGARVMVKGETDIFGNVYELMTFEEGDHPIYFVEFDNGARGVYDRSELIEVAE